MYNNTTNNQQPATVGSFVEQPDTGFKGMLTKLSETFSSQYQLDYISDISTIMKHQGTINDYNSILLEDYMNCETADPEFHRLNGLKLQQLCENSRKAILSESSVASLNPVVGLTFPLLKRFWVECEYKDFIPTEVATTPAFNLAIKKEYIQDANGKKHYLPDALFENLPEIMAAVRQELSKDTITVPNFEYDLITQAGGSIKQEDSISRDFYISSVIIKVPNDTAEEEVEVKTRIPVTAPTNSFQKLVVANGKGTKEKDVVKDFLSGSLDFETGKLNVACSQGKITGIKVTGYLSSENHLRTASTGWDPDIKQFMIPDGIHLATGLTEERLKDESVLFHIDATADAISTMTEVLKQLKDISIRDFLGKSKDRIKNTKYYKSAVFDCIHPDSYNQGPIEWRKQVLKETLDRLALNMKYILKNKNCYFAVMGNPMDIKLLDNINWIYGQDTEVGGTKLDYNIGLYNDQHRFYVVSSERATQGSIQILLIPTTDEIITYKHFEYQFIISNQYRHASNVRVPSVMASDRSLTDEVTPVQGEIFVMNNDKIGISEMYKNYTV